MAKFKVGDKVRILPRKVGQRHQLPNYIDDMAAHVGDIATVKSVGPTTVTLYEHAIYGWHEDWLELVVRAISSKEDMEALYG